MKTIIERGASWTLEETKLLLALWGQDLVARQATKLKRTKEVYESISDKFLKEGYERTPDQVRTRVFNMIAEYRRILKDPNPERKQKCVFFEPLDRIYQAKHLTDVKSAIDEYELVNPYSPESISRVSISSCDGNQHNIEDLNDDNSNSTLNNLSNNNNNATTGAAKPHATTSEMSKTTNNIVGSKNSATNDSITDNTPVKKLPVSREGQSTTKKLKTDSPKAGTSFGGDTTMDESFVPVDSKITIKGGSANHNINSSASNASNAALSYTNNASTSSGTGAKQQQQSLLATAGTSSSMTTPINKGSTNPAAFININSGNKLPMFRSQILGHTNGNEAININGTQASTARLPTTAAITSHQLFQAPVNTFDVTSSALLIDRMFAHLSKESENMREWIALEKERIALERARRSQETEREIRRERVLVETLMKFQEQWLTFVRRIDPRIEEGAVGPLPELNIPKEVLEPLNIDHKGGAQEGSGSKASQSSISPATKMSTTSATSPANPTTNSSTSVDTNTTPTIPGPSTPPPQPTPTATTTSASSTSTSTSSAVSDRPPVKSY